MRGGQSLHNYIINTHFIFVQLILAKLNLDILPKSHQFV